MASLTPGTLSKLLQHSTNNSIHRSPLLQVIGIVPALTGDDPWSNQGFYLKVSDSLHCAYVLMSDDDVDLIFSDKIQLGQFIQVARIDSGSSVPVLRGVKPVAKRRECVGSPVDLGSSEALPFRSNVGFKEGFRKKEGVKRLEFGDARTVGRQSSVENVGVEVTQARRLSLDSMRKGWEKSSKGAFKAKHSASVGLDKKASSTRESSLNQISLIKSPSKSKSKSPPLKVTTNPSNSGIKPPKENALPSHLVKVSLHGKTCFDQSFSLTSIPASIHDLGKDVVRRKNAACLASVNALHEASAAENIIRCLSVFAELCDSARQDSPGLTVKKFLDLSHSMQQAASVVDALFKVRSSKAIAIASQLPSSDVHKLFNDKHANASSWVHAALETDLSTFSHFSKQEKKGKPHNGENYHCVVLETRDPAEVEPKNHSPQNKKNLKGTPSPKRWLGISAIKKVKEERGDWSKGKGLNEVSSLAKRLLFVSRKWFLKYLEDSLNDGFGSNLGKGNEISSLLGQLKRVNHWLEKANGDGSKVDERVDNLKKKLYNFLLEHVDSTVY